MSNTGIAAFDSTMHTTNVWLNELADRMGWQDKQRAYHALRVVLQALRDHLPVDQAAALGAQLPMLIRGFYYEGWHPHGKPIKQRKKDEFLAQIGKALRDEPDVIPEDIVQAVFQVIAKHVTPGETEHVKITLPSEIRSLWSPESHSMWF
jgi:uncharacterized protein (DUF2267 family)